MNPIRLADYERVVFFTGAGISAESGVPTYRGAGGIWGQYNWEDYACQRAFDSDPQKVLDFHETRRARVLECEPNPGHKHLAALQAVHAGVSVITQNTDGLLRRVGCRELFELHGSLWRLRCPEHGVTEDLAAAKYARRACANCGTVLRPDIVWFEDPVSEAVFAEAGRRIGKCHLFVAVGTSAVVFPAAGLIPLAKQAGARMIEVNIGDSDMSDLFDERLRGRSGEILPQMFPREGAHKK
jgi:NAD-dependent deacetylase